MIDLRFVRENPEIVRQSQLARQEDPHLVDEIIAADDARRSTLTAFENLRAEQKAASRQVAKASETERPALLARAREMAGEVKRLQAEADAAAERCQELSLALSNVVIDGVPSGGEDDYRVMKHVGEIRDFAADGVTIRDHLELGEGLGAIDVKRGTKVSGSRFYYLRGVGARLELALLTMAVDYAESQGFTLMMTPTLVSPEIMGGTGFLGAHSDEVYHLPVDDLYLTGTSEVALAGYHKNDVLDLSAGPIRYSGWSTCYRREAGSYGKDVRGIIRVHQFNKVEMFSYCHPEQAEEEHAKLLAFEEDMLAKTEMPYRVIDTAAGDLGSSAARKYDCEAYLPSQDRYLEVTSTSNCTTFQARRLAIRYREDGENKIAATLNGTLATTRWLVPFLENHQQADGSIYIPEAMRPYLGGREVLTPETPRGF